jgi:hypothetical protein
LIEYIHAAFAQLITIPLTGSVFNLPPTAYAPSLQVVPIEPLKFLMNGLRNKDSLGSTVLPTYTARFRKVKWF